jgi:lysophospholipase L1-like esterase
MANYSKFLWASALLGLVFAAAAGLYRQVYITGKLEAAEGRFAEKASWPEQGKADVILFGDSRIARWLPMPGLPGVNIQNRGIGGSTTRQMLTRFETDVLDMAPKIVVIQAGVNDLVAAGLNPEHKERLVAATIANIAEMCKRASERGIRVVLLKIIPPSSVSKLRWLFWSNDIPELVDRTNKELESIQSRSTIIYDVEKTLLINGKWPEAYVADELHVTRDAYVTLNAELEPVLAGLLGR